MLRHHIDCWWWLQQVHGHWPYPQIHSICRSQMANQQFQLGRGWTGARFPTTLLCRSSSRVQGHAAGNRTQPAKMVPELPHAFFVWRSSGTQDAGNCVKRVKAGDNARSTPSPQHDAMHTFKKPAHNEFIILATFATCRRRSVHVGFIMSLLALFRVSQTLSLGCNVISSPVDMQRRLPDADEC